MVKKAKKRISAQESRGALFVRVLKFSVNLIFKYN